MINDPGKPCGSVDAADNAKSRLEKKRAEYRFSVIFSWVMFALLVLVFAATVALALHYKQNVVKGYAVDYRPCSVTLDNENVVTGERSYSYGYSEYLSHRWRNNAVVTEKTKFISVGAPMMILEHTGAEYKKVLVGQGEKGDVAVDNAGMYTIIQNGGVAVVDYGKFCK